MSLKGWDSLGSLLSQMKITIDLVEEQYAGERTVEKVEAMLLSMAMDIKEEFEKNDLFSTSMKKIVEEFLGKLKEVK